MAPSILSLFTLLLGVHSILTMAAAPQPHQFHVAPQNHFIHPVAGTYPRLCHLADGSLLAGYTAFGADNLHTLTVIRSTDQGRTFHALGEVTRSHGDCDNLFLLQLPNGNILAAFRNHDLSDDPEPKHTYFRITVCQSTDQGKTWKFLSQAVEKSAPWGMWEPFLRLGGQDGKEVQLFYSLERAGDDQDTMVVRSVDGGKSWSAPESVTGAGERLRDGMVGVAETRDSQGKGALVMVMETTRRGGGLFSVEAVVSYDGGRNFGERQVVYEPREGRNAGAPQVAAFADGSVAVVFMTDEDRVETPDWPKGAKVKVVFSGPPQDGRFQWTEPRVVGDTASFWPGVLSVGDDAVLAVYAFSSSIRGRMLRLTS